MRISTGQLHNMGLNSILEQQAKLINIQQQLASGKRLLEPSDDPSAAASILNIDQSLKITEQYQGNIDTARSRQNIQEETLIGINDIMHRVRELAIQGNKSTLTSVDRASIATEVRENLDALLALSVILTSTV